MYEVREFVENSRQVADFLEKTCNYGKRFYRKIYYTPPSTIPQIDVLAIAISRELTHILRWTIECSKIPVFDTVDPTENPEQGFVPKDAMMRECWFPCIEHNNYIDVFHYNGFTNVYSIKEDNTELEV